MRISVPSEGRVAARRRRGRKRGLGDDRRGDVDGGDHQHRPMTFGSTCDSMMASGLRPTTRAACTYSFSFSTMVEPRTVRAYCTQPAKPIGQHQHRNGELVVAIARQRDARHAVDEQRNEDRRERELPRRRCA